MSKPTLRFEGPFCFASGEQTLITSSDKEFKSTKQIKQGLRKLAPPFDKLAQWIHDKWSVTVLNVIYDGRNELHTPRIQVILEHEVEAQSFHKGVNFDCKKQNAIAAKFREIIDCQPNHQWDIEGLFVVFSAFAPIAKEEADSKISQRRVDALKRRIGNPDLWKIARSFGRVTFMFYTDAQVIEYTANGLKAEYTRRYFQLLKPYDEFGYLSEKDFAVYFDSKQNFDDNYEGNWFYYDR